MNTFLTSNTWQMRLARTIVQAIVAFIFDNIVVILAATNVPAEIQTIIVGGFIAIQSPVYHALGMRTAEKLKEPTDDDIPDAD